LTAGRPAGSCSCSWATSAAAACPRARIDKLAERLDLDLGRRIKALSRGNRQKLGVVAFMHAPELLIGGVQLRRPHSPAGYFVSTVYGLLIPWACPLCRAVN
jgi:hypothetical protein